MAQLGIRGSNPIWTEFNLQGLLFDSSYYMYVLQNTIPYIPSDVYHDPDLNVIWDNPIQFLANGTLPIDIFFVADQVYRLEFRKNNGIDAPSQSDPLIYEVNNYIAGTGGSNPVDTLAFATSNQITNPQFALISFSSPFSLIGVTNPDPIQVAPGWFLELTGTGNVTLERIALNNSSANPSNAPYALRLTLLGWNSPGVYLRQRFEQNGMLWANKTVSSTITARIPSPGVPQPISANLIDSNLTPLGTVLTVPIVNSSFNEFTGHADLTGTTNPNTPPAAYIDYKLLLPSNVTIDVTSFQLVVQDLPVRPSFEQDSINRQIDHTYNTAYPIVPVGTIIDFGGFDSPLHYLPCDGTAYNRQNYNLLFNTITTTEAVTLTTAVATFTVVSGGKYRVGMKVEGTGIPALTTITNIVANTITISLAATITGASTVRFFAAGNGDGSTTFNVYDLRDYVIAGTGGSAIFGSESNGIGAVSGSATHTLTSAQLPNPLTATAGDVVVASGGVYTVIASGSGTGAAGTILNPGGGNAFSILQQTMLMKKLIRYE